jgi:hypothetical protein
MAKLTPLLENRLRQAAPGDLVDVVIEMSDLSQIPKEPGTKTRAERHAAFEHDFGVSTKELTHLIDSVGGKVLASSWLSGAIKARVPVDSIERLRALENVEVIDVPHHLTRG